MAPRKRNNKSQPTSLPPLPPSLASGSTSSSRPGPPPPPPRTSNRKRSAAQLDTPEVPAEVSSASTTTLTSSSSSPRPAKRQKALGQPAPVAGPSAHPETDHAETKDEVDESKVQVTREVHPIPRRSPRSTAAATLAGSASPAANKGKQTQTSPNKPKPKSTPPKPKSTKSPKTSPRDHSLLNEVKRTLAFKKLFDSLKESAACPICRETLRKPYALRCGHTFCRPCLDSCFHRPAPDDGSGTGSAASADDSESDSSSSDSSSDSSSSDSESDSGSVAASVASVSPRSRARIVEMDGEAVSQVETESESSEDEDVNPHGASHLSWSTGGFVGSIIPLGGRAGEEATWDTIAEGLHRMMRGGPATTAPAPNRRMPSAQALRDARIRAIENRTGANSNSGAPVSTSAFYAESPAARASASAGPAPAPARQGPPPPVRMPPTGAHRKTNLRCPTCRIAVDEAPPTKVFALTEMVKLLREAEAPGGPLAPSGSDEGTALPEEEAEDALDEKDITWGGLFRDPLKAETAKEKHARLAHPVRDRDDRVRRCGHCNWEIDEQTGECQGCNAIWDLSDADDEVMSISGSDDDEGEDLVRPSRRRLRIFGDGDGDHSEDARSEDEEEMNSDDAGFLDDEVVEGTGSDSDGLSSNEESAVETSPDTRRRKRKQRIAREKKRELMARRKNKRTKGEVIDLESTAESRSGQDDEDDESSASADEAPLAGLSRRSKATIVVLSSDDEEDEDAVGDGSVLVLDAPSGSSSSSPAPTAGPSKQSKAKPGPKSGKQPQKVASSSSSPKSGSGDKAQVDASPLKRAVAEPPARKRYQKRTIVASDSE